jgi:competence protein ComEC
LPGPLAGWLLGFAGWVTELLFMLLAWLSQLQPSAFSSTRTPGLASTLLAMLGAVVVLLPKGIPLRFLGALLMLPMLLTSAQNPSAHETRVDLLDVGQGLAVLLSTQNYLMVYDTGPGNGRVDDGGWDMVAGSIGPMIDASGLAPDLVVASHADLDHAGGLNRLRGLYPGALFLASLPKQRAGIEDCRAPRAWRAGSLSFEVLHPSSGLPYLGNNSSCVISVTGAGISVLLSGDISQTVERRLVERGLQPHDIITVPHHGSSTSSSQALIAAARPSLALISAGMNNRFDFPRAEVIKRYAQAGIPILNTAGCGGIRITGQVDGTYMAESARVVRKAIWRWPAEAGCPTGR